MCVYFVVLLNFIEDLKYKQDHFRRTWNRDFDFVFSIKLKRSDPRVIVS